MLTAESVLSLVNDLVSEGGYAGVFLAMLIENFLQFIPSEAIMPLAGFLVAEGKLGFIQTCLAGTLGTILGTLPWYGIGRIVNEQKIELFVQRHGTWLGITTTKLKKSRQWFHRYGNAIVFWGRLVPILRTLVSIPAGIEMMPIRPFLLWTSLGSLTWNILLTSAGYLLGKNWGLVHSLLKPISLFVAFCLVAFLVVYVLGRNTSADP
jgi:membrane protein DedA with SNARE-associated domain